MRVKYITAGLLLWALTGFSAAAGENGRQFSVVELFTSQGCSSCPPADALLGEFATRKDIIALTFPVDYWDYLGWEDTLSHPANARRQRAYAARRGDHEVYTPQVVINGIAHAVGSRKAQIEKIISSTARKQAPDRIPISMKISKDVLTVKIAAAPPGAKPQTATLWLILFQDEVRVSVRRGENYGRKMVYYNVVREMTPVAMWNGKAQQINLPKSDLMGQGYDGCVLILQHGNGGPILGAARMSTWRMRHSAM